MEIIDIFVDTNSWEGIYSTRYDDEEEDEYSRLLNLWSDPEYVISYLKANKSFLETDFFKNESIDSLSVKIEKETSELERLMLELVKGGFEKNGTKLENLFRPLENSDGRLYVHQLSKAVLYDHHFARPILRFYAVRISSNTFVITGGSIKLTHNMDEHEDTKKELAKLSTVKALLKNNDLLTEEDIKTFIHEY